jgi:methyl-accepting chemotaxis protein
MDELTQQNAALVEQATASSQAMADQARELNEMMNRYRVQAGEALAAAVTSESAAGSAAGERAAPAARAPAVERRSKTRPWAGKRAAAPAAASNGSAGHAMPAPAARKQASNSDSDWQEF